MLTSYSAVPSFSSNEMIFSTSASYWFFCDVSASAWLFRT